VPFFGSPAVRLSPGPWLCVPVSRRVCRYRKGLRTAADSGKPCATRGCTTWARTILLRQRLTTNPDC